MRLDGDEWWAFFDSYQHEAFRLETLPVYTMAEEDEEYRNFLETGRLEVAEDDPWLVRVRGYRASGRTIGRVHVIRKPITDYLRFEFAYYARSAGAGEDVRILDLTGKPDPGLPDQDFWMFDSARVVEMRYRADGTQIGRVLLESPDLDQYTRWRDLAVSLSVPFTEYVPE
jgi:hypothetical protein